MKQLIIIVLSIFIFASCITAKQYTHHNHKKCSEPDNISEIPY